jgi:hypothetical protein
MAQVTGTFPQSCGEVEISSDYTTWEDISGETASVQDTSQSRMSGETYTLDGDTAILGQGKREPMQITLTIVYTEAADEAFRKFAKEFEAAECGDDMWMRWSPGEGIGDYKYTTDENYSHIVEFEYPPLDATTAGPIVCRVVLRTAKVERRAATS